jgi:hypothetical protein
VETVARNGNCSYHVFLPFSAFETIQNVMLDIKSYRTDHQVVLNCQKQNSTVN